MRFLIEMQQLQPHLPVIAWQCRPHRARIRPPALQLQLHAHCSQRQNPRRRPHHQLFQHHANHEEQRLQHLHRRIQFHALFQAELRLQWHK